MMSPSFAAGVLAYVLATFNGGYLWHLVLFNDMYLSLKVWTRFPEDIGLQLGASAVLLQQALLVAYMLPIFQRATGRSGTLSGALFGLWVAGLVFSVAVLAHSAKNQSACVEGFVAMEGLYCLLQFPLSCSFVAFSQGRAARQAPSKKAA
ncbi:unnamed protein product [Ectocarpus sp. 6 AP-2014]